MRLSNRILQFSLPSLKYTFATSSTSSQLPKDPHRKKRTQGPQLQITKLLLIHGPLTSKQLWRTYTRELEQTKQDAKPQTKTEQYFASLSQLKKTLKYMRSNGKISSNGYDKSRRQFRGWKANEERSLKYVHPTVIQNIKSVIKRKDEL